MLRELSLRAEVRGKCASTPSLITDTFLPQDHPKCRLLESLTEPALKTPSGDCRSGKTLGSKRATKVWIERQFYCLTAL